MKVSELLKLCTWQNQLFDVRNGSIENNEAIWFYNLGFLDVLDTFGNKTVKMIYSDTTQDHIVFMTDYIEGLTDEPENEELTNISIVLADELKIGDRIIVNRECDTKDWRYAVATVKHVGEDMVTFVTDKSLSDGNFPRVNELTLYKYKVDLLEEE